MDGVFLSQEKKSQIFSVFRKVEICGKTCYNNHISHLESVPQFFTTRNICTVMPAQRRPLCKPHKRAADRLTKRAGGSGSDGGALDVGSFEDTSDGFIKIIPPVNGITGVVPAYTLPETGIFYNGVFIAGRKVKLSPYKLGKIEVTYKLWKEVYDWAVKSGSGYTFPNAGRKGSDGTGSDEEPVTMISWLDCIVWCNAYTEMTKGSESECVYRKSKTDPTVLKDATDTAACKAAYADMDKKGFRLPTEAEWKQQHKCGAIRRSMAYQAEQCKRREKADRF